MKLKLATIALSLLCVWQMNSQSTIDDHQTKHPVEHLFLSSIEAFNNSDLELFLSNFASEIKMYGTDGLYEGKDALRERFKTVFEQFPNKKMDITELKLSVLSSDIVLVHFKWQLYPMGKGPAYRGVGSGLYTLKGNSWTEILEAETVTEVDEALMQKG